MSKSHKNAATLNSYAQALLELADARSSTTQVAEDLQGVAHVIEQDPAFGQYLADPSVGNANREQALDRVFTGRVNELLLTFLKLLNAKGRLGDLPGIADAFKAILDKRAGNVDVEVIVAQSLDAGELEGVRQQISSRLGKNANVSQRVDESIIGGIVLKVGDSLIDGSVKTQLETIKRRLVAAV